MCRGLEPFPFRRRTTDVSQEEYRAYHRVSYNWGGALRAEVVRQVSVPAEACVYFAGGLQPDLEAAYPPDANWASDPWDVGGAPNHSNFHNDTAPWAGVVRATNNTCSDASSPTGRVAASTIPPCIPVGDLQGLPISITGTGQWGRGPCDPDGNGTGTGPDGWVGNPATAHAEYDDLGISHLQNCLSHALVGVFLGDFAPNPGSLPATLNCSSSDMTHPMLQQQFRIGAALLDVHVPTGATRLCLGFHDQSGWFNNDGDVAVRIASPVPAVSTWGLAIMGLLVLTTGTVAILRRNRAAV